VILYTSAPPPAQRVIADARPMIQTARVLVAFDGLSIRTTFCATCPMAWVGDFFIYSLRADARRRVLSQLPRVPETQ